MPEYYGLSGYRPRIRYADIIRAEAPAAQRRYWADKNYGLQQQADEQQKAQFDASMALQEAQMKEEQRQAALSNTISTVGLGIMGYPYLKKGAGKAYDLLSSGLDKTSEMFGGGEDMTTLDSSSQPVTPVSGIGEAAIPGDQAIMDTYAPVYETPGYQNIVAEGRAPAQYGLGEAAAGGLGYSAGEQAILGTYAPVYTSPAYDALIAEGAQVGGLGAGEAAVSSGALEGGSLGGGLSSLSAAIAPAILYDVGEGGPITQTAMGLGRGFGEYIAKPVGENVLAPVAKGIGAVGDVISNVVGGGGSGKTGGLRRMLGAAAMNAGLKSPWDLSESDMDIINAHGGYESYLNRPQHNIRQSDNDWERENTTNVFGNLGLFG